MTAEQRSEPTDAHGPLSIRIELLSARELESVRPTLVELLQESANAGASLGFLPPLKSTDAHDYWRSLPPQLESGARLLLVAYWGSRIVGSGQLSLAPWSDGQHRATLEKIFVGSALRGRGIGRLLLASLESQARLRRRSLLLINAREGSLAEIVYRRAGYRAFGVIPGYSVGPASERYNNVCLYRQIAL